MAEITIEASDYVEDGMKSNLGLSNYMGNDKDPDWSSFELKTKNDEPLSYV